MIDATGTLSDSTGCAPSELPASPRLLCGAGRIARLLQRRGLGLRPTPKRPTHSSAVSPCLLRSMALRYPVGPRTGPRAGMRVTTVGAQIDAKSPEVLAGPRLCQRIGRECSCRSLRSGTGSRAPGASLPLRRPSALAIERLSLLPDGRLLYRLKRHWRMERRTSSFDRLSSWRSSPRFVRARDSTWSVPRVLAPAAMWRPYVVPSTALPDSPGHPGCRAKSAGTVDLLPEVGCLPATYSIPPRNYSWAELLRRVFALDVLECPTVRTHENPGGN